MDLFNNQNLLHIDGNASYLGPILNPEECQYYCDRLLNNIAWQHDQAIIFGKHLVTARQVAWYGDRAYRYSYSNHTKIALPWNADLLALKKRVEQHAGETFNACLLNRYDNGSQGMAWHSDAETDLKKYGTIASLSLGAERKFSFKHKRTKASLSVILQNGSLLLMKDQTQQHWLHCLPSTKTVTRARINLTFRTIVNQ